MKHGLELADTPVMALHRGRIDLLEIICTRSTTLPERFSHEGSILPNSAVTMRCWRHKSHRWRHNAVASLCDYDEIEIARWLLEHGGSKCGERPRTPPFLVGITALFGTVVSQPNFW